MTHFTAVLSQMFHLAFIRVMLPGLVLILYQYLMVIVTFDYTANSWDIDISWLIPSKEYKLEFINRHITS